MRAPIQPITPLTAAALKASAGIATPCAAVKELLDNLIDADATSITIEIDTTGGLSHLSVTDNGRGVPLEDRALMCANWTTSKNTHERTLGFRGEALFLMAQLCAQGTMYITTKTETDVVAGRWQVGPDAASGPVVSVPAPRGTQITLKGLFSAFPVRRAFWEKKSTSTLSEVKRLVVEYAMVYRHIRFVMKPVRATSSKRVAAIPSREVVFNPGLGTLYGSIIDPSPLFKLLHSLRGKARNLHSGWVELLPHWKLVYVLPPRDVLPFKDGIKVVAVNGRPLSGSLSFAKAMTKALALVYLAPGGALMYYLHFVTRLEDVDVTIEPEKNDLMTVGVSLEEVVEAVVRSLGEIGGVPESPLGTTERTPLRAELPDPKRPDTKARCLANASLEKVSVVKVEEEEKRLGILVTNSSCLSLVNPSLLALLPSNTYSRVESAAPLLAGSSPASVLSQNRTSLGGPVPTNAEIYEMLLSSSDNEDDLPLSRLPPRSLPPPTSPSPEPNPEPNPEPSQGSRAKRLRDYTLLEAPPVPDSNWPLTPNQTLSLPTETPGQPFFLSTDPLNQTLSLPTGSPSRSQMNVLSVTHRGLGCFMRSPTQPIPKERAGRAPSVNLTPLTAHGEAEPPIGYLATPPQTMKSTELARRATGAKRTESLAVLSSRVSTRQPRVAFRTERVSAVSPALVTLQTTCMITPQTLNACASSTAEAAWLFRKGFPTSPLTESFASKVSVSVKDVSLTKLPHGWFILSPPAGVAGGLGNGGLLQPTT